MALQILVSNAKTVESCGKKRTSVFTDQTNGRRTLAIDHFGGGSLILAQNRMKV